MIKVSGYNRFGFSPAICASLRGQGRADLIEGDIDWYDRARCPEALRLEPEGLFCAITLHALSW